MAGRELSPARRQQCDLSMNREEYSLRQARLIAGCKDFIPSPELMERLFHEISREEEIASDRRDALGNWEWSFSNAQRAGKQYRPWLDEEIQSVVGPPVQPRWPQGKKWALCLTHDVDLVSQWDRGLRVWRGVRNEMSGPWDRRRFALRTARAAWRTVRNVFRAGDDPLWCYEQWLEVEAQYGFRSSFLVFPSTVRRRHRDDCYFRLHDPVKFDGNYMTVGAMLGRMAERGWDIGVHGSCRTWNDAAMLEEQRLEIEQAAGKPVVSTRQHYLRYSAAETPAVHQAAGLAVDSTCGWNRNIGFRAGTSFPWWCWSREKQCALPLLEVPMAIMDTALLNGVLDYTEEQGVEHCLEIMDRVVAVGGCLTLNWHPNYIREPRFWNSYRTILAEAARRDPWCGTLCDIHRHRVQHDQSYPG